jgi:pilus assembly protein CpaC
MVKSKQYPVLTAWVLALAGLLMMASAGAQVESPRTLGLADTETLRVPLFKSEILRLSAPAARVSVGSPDIADIIILRATQLYVLGKDLGTTNVLLWDRQDNLVGTINVEVTHDLESLKANLFDLLPNERVEVFSSQRSIVLRGTLSSVENMKTALRLAEGYLAQIQAATEATEFEQAEPPGGAGEVINMMQVAGAQQVMLEVKVAEINRRVLRRMHAQFNALHVGGSNWNFGGVNGGASFPQVEFVPGNVRVPVFDNVAPWGPAISEFMPDPMRIQNQGLFASFLSDSFLFNLALDAAREEGLATILAEPTLTTLTGEEARFLSGGEFPIPVPQGVQGITVEFKEFGVGVGFLPVVLGGGVINMRLNVSVSELVTTAALGIQPEGTTAGFVIPALSRRSANATVELREGQTIGIAGLINENNRGVVTKFPLLGEIPILGTLFRSKEFINNESELVILVTPHLAKPIAPADIRLPTDVFVPPGDLAFYLLGRLEGRARPARASSNPRPTGGADAQYGHRLE